METRFGQNRHSFVLVILAVLILSFPCKSFKAYGDTPVDRIPAVSAPNFFTSPAKYLKIYLDNRRAFAPYSKEKRKTPHEQAVLLYRHLCQDHKIKFQCKKFKKDLVSFFESQLNLVDSTGKQQGIDTENGAKYVEQLDQVVKNLRTAYQEARNTIDREMRLVLFEDSSQSEGDGQTILKPRSAEEYNLFVQSIFQRDPVQAQIEDYRQSYWAAARDFHGEILLSDTLHGRIEGGFYNIVFNDVILSIEELAQKPQDEFENNLLQHPEVADSIIEGADEQVIFLASKLLEEELKTGWDRSNHLTPRTVDAEIFELIQSYHSNDVEVVRLLARRRFQRAIWRLVDIGQIEKAEGLEEYLSKSILAVDNISKISHLGGGFTTTQLVRFKDGTAGVFKPKPWSKMDGSVSIFQNLKDTLVSHYKKEVAAYRINSNKMIGLNLVPLTEIKTIGGSVGSLQYFVKHATMGRFMQDVAIENPRQAGKWTHPSGRTALPKKVVLFDWLINNHDRNIDNYLLSDDGRIVLIDHSWSFLDLVFFRPNAAQIEAMFSSEAIFDKINYLNQHPEIINEQLEDLLSHLQLKIFKEKIKFMAEYVNRRIKLEGRERVFAVR